MLRIGVVMYQTSLTKGQELVAERMVREFRRQGYDAYLITSIFEDWEPTVSNEEITGRGGFLHLYDERLRIPLIRVDSYQGTWPPRRIFFRNFIDILKHIVEELRLNVLITHSTLWNGPEEVAKFMAWRRELIVNGSIQEPMLFCHMSHFQEPSDERYALGERSYREAWNKVSLSRIVADADLLLVTNPKEADEMKKFGVENNRIFLFPAGIEDDILEARRGSVEVREKYKIPKNARLVTYLGTVEERKNALALLQVAELLSQRKDIHFVVAGKLEGEYGAKMSEEAREHTNVALTGPISEEERAQLIRESYLNISLSRSEALGITQLEFMYGGVPVITSGVGGQSWIVHNGENGVVLDGPDDTDGAASAILDLVSRPSRRQRLGRGASRSVSQYSLTRLIHRLSKALVQMFQEGKEGMTPLTIEPSEKVLEAWVKDNYRVVVTTENLTIVPLRRVKEAASIPLDKIKGVRHHVKALWSALLVGAAGTIILLVTRIFGWNWDATLTNMMMRFAAAEGLVVPNSPDLSIGIVFLPLVISALVFVLTAQKGYLVQSDASKGAFVPATFVKALRLADKLTPDELFLNE